MYRFLLLSKPFHCFKPRVRRNRISFWRNELSYYIDLGAYRLDSRTFSIERVGTLFSVIKPKFRAHQFWRYNHRNASVDNFLECPQDMPANMVVLPFCNWVRTGGSSAQGNQDDFIGIWANSAIFFALLPARRQV